MSKNFNIHKNIYLYLKAAFSLLFPPPQNQQLHPASNLLGLSTQNAPAPTTKRSNRTINKAPPLPPQGIRSAGGTLSGQPEGGSGPQRSPRKAAGA